MTSSSATTAWPLATIDFEASSLEEDSYPIEVGIAILRCPGAVPNTWSALIRPHWQWLSNGHWSKRSGKVHGLSLLLLQEQGTAVTDVATALNEKLTGLTVFCDGLPYDAYWLTRLYDAAGLQPTFTLAAAVRVDTEINPAQSSSPKAHRALPDAEQLLRSLIDRCHP